TNTSGSRRGVPHDSGGGADRYSQALGNLTGEIAPRLPLGRELESRQRMETLLASTCTEDVRWPQMHGRIGDRVLKFLPLSERRSTELQSGHTIRNMQDDSVL